MFPVSMPCLQAPDIEKAWVSTHRFRRFRRVSPEMPGNILLRCRLTGQWEVAFPIKPTRAAPLRPSDFPATCGVSPVMANDPNDTDRMPAPKKQPDKASQPELKLPPEEEELPATEPMTGPPLPLPPLPEGDAFDAAIPLADPASGIKSGTRLPAGASHEDPEAAVGNLEPVAPVAPASGWLDSDVPLPNVGPAPRLPDMPEADLETTPKVESSDIFSTGAVPPPPVIGGSDVIVATAFGPIPVEPEKPTRPSDVAISFDQPLGGSTISSASGSGDLPVADEVFEGPDPMFDSSRLGGMQPPSADAADFGSTPDQSDDTSSILADLSDPGDITIDDSSAIRLESPGIQRTLSSQPSSGTEFDLTVGEGDIPPELAAAEDEAAASGLPSAWAKKRKSDPDERTVPELDLERAGEPIDPRLRSGTLRASSTASTIRSCSGSRARPRRRTTRKPRSSSRTTPTPTWSRVPASLGIPALPRSASPRRARRANRTSNCPPSRSAPRTAARSIWERPRTRVRTRPRRVF